MTSAQALSHTAASEMPHECADSDGTLFGSEDSILRCCTLDLLICPSLCSVVSESLGLGVLVHGGVAQQCCIVQIHHLHIRFRNASSTRRKNGG